MKALRIACYCAAAYYLFYGGILLMTALVSETTLASLRQTGSVDLMEMQQISAEAARQAAPYLFIGAAVCLLLALATRALWKAIPVVAALLFAGSIAWMIAYAQAAAPYYDHFNSIMEQAPGAIGGFSKRIVESQRYSAYAPVLLPALALFIFWWKSKQERSSAQIAERPAR